ncbi:ABC transporter permease [Pseudomonas aeruginosa]|nr:ABC transporter permease [Pseudomonas aeruginosa]
MSRTWRLLLWPLLVVAAVGASFAYLDMDTAGLFSGKGLGQMAAYASEFFPPDLSAPHLRAIGRGLLETLAMSAIGTLLAALLGLLFALPAAGRFGVPAQSLARLLLNALRAVPELVWGALMVLAAGLGPNAGTLALALHTGGVLGRLFAEALENTPAQPPRPCAWPAADASRHSPMAPCRGSGRNWWPIPCTAGRTISAWPACSVSSAPAGSGRCSISASACSSRPRPPR